LDYWLSNLEISASIELSPRTSLSIPLQEIISKTQRIIQWRLMIMFTYLHF
jgi:hypothetical protein